MSLKICMLAYSFYENDNRVRRYAEALASRGDSVDIVSLKRKCEDKYKKLNGVNIYGIQEREGNEKGKFSYLYNLLVFFIRSSAFLTLKQIKNSYDIVHVHSVPDFEVFAASIAKMLGSKIILDIHDPVPDFFCAKFNSDKNSIYYRLLSFIERMSTKFADHVITVTDYWKEVISMRSGIPPQKISVIINLPDINIFNLEKIEKKEKLDDHFIILYPGTLNKHCGIDIMLEAMALIKDEIPDFRFLIYGKGSEYDNIQLMINNLHLENNVFLKGMVPLDVVPELMYQADVGIALLSGQNEYSQQALNVKLFEFLAMGLPAIATRTKSIEYYLNEDIVMLSDQNNPEDVARCIKELYLNLEKRSSLRMNGLNYIKRNNWNLLKNSFLKIIDDLTK